MAENRKRDDRTRIACAKFGHFLVVKYSRDVTGEPRDENGQWTDSGDSAVENLAKTATERGWSVKVMAKKAIEAGIDPVKLRNTAAEIVKSGKAKRPNFRSDHGRGKVIDDGSGLSDDEISENFNSADDLLKKHGGVMNDESDSGSRYYSIPNGGKVRVADHEPNEATSQWIERNDVHQIRTDKRTFKSALQQVIDEMRGSVKYSRDVSGEARDEDGRWTESGGGSGEERDANGRWACGKPITGATKVAKPIEPFPKTYEELQKREFVDLWHGTTLQRLEAIMGGGRTKSGERGQLCVSPNFKHASQYPEFPGDDEDPIVIAVRVPVKSLRPDENDSPGVSLKDSLFRSENESAADADGGIDSSQIIGVFGSSPDDPWSVDEVGDEIARRILSN
jgi:hypothetical protein